MYSINDPTEPSLWYCNSNKVTPILSPGPVEKGDSTLNVRAPQCRQPSEGRDGHCVTEVAS